jgi:hypothetical protein
MKNADDQDPVACAETLSVTPGDVLFSSHAIPFPDTILSGFKKNKWLEVQEPRVNFEAVQVLLEFLEFAVLCERLIVPVPTFAPRTQRLVASKKWEFEFAAYCAAGDLEFTKADLCDPLETAGVLSYAQIAVGDANADETLERLMPTSRSLKERSAYYLSAHADKGPRAPEFARASMARWYGAPLHVAHAASITGVPYVLGGLEARHLENYDQENIATRRGITQILLERLNEGARRELARLADFGAVSVFPETPIASQLIYRATSAKGLVDAALEMRDEFAAFRRAMVEIESDLASAAQPTKLRLKRLKQLQQLGDSLWGGERTDLRANAVSLSESLAAIPEAVIDPSVSSVSKAASKLLTLPVDKILHVYRRRKIRLLLKAKRDFLARGDSTKRIAKILGVDEEIAMRSRLQRNRKNP